MWDRVVQKLLANQTLTLANRVAPLISTSLLTGMIVSGRFSNKTVTNVPVEKEPKFKLSPLERWRATTWI